MTSRSEQRKSFTQINRIALLERDADEIEGALEDVRNDLRAIRNILMGLLVSVTTGCVLLVINVIVHAY